jgi:selenide,water dikinase
LSEITRGSHVDAELSLPHVPFIDGAAELANAGAIPGGSLDNLDYVADLVTFDTTISRTQKILLADAQTSGGLLFAVHPDQADKFLSALQQKCDTSIAIIGKITAHGSGRIHVAGKRP